MPKSPQLLQIREEQWQSRIESLTNYAVQHGYAVPTLTTWFPGNTIETLASCSLPMCQRAFYPGRIRIAAATNEAGEQAELFAILANATKRGDTELQYIKRTPAGTVKISHESIEHDAWSHDQCTDFVASPDSDMERGSVRWYLKIRLMCFIALVLAGHYDETVIVDGELQATHREVQKSLFRTVQKHLGQRTTTTSSTQQPATDSLSRPSTAAYPNLSYSQATPLLSQSPSTSLSRTKIRICRSYMCRVRWRLGGLADLVAQSLLLLSRQMRQVALEVRSGL